VGKGRVGDRQPDSNLNGPPPLIGSTINSKLIAAQWQEVLRLAASIRQGTVTASLILRKLGSYPRQNSLAAALRDSAHTHPIEPVEPATVPRPCQVMLQEAFHSLREPALDNAGSKVVPQSPGDCGRRDLGVRPPGREHSSAGKASNASRCAAVRSSRRGMR
jgi:hypothetical protein